LITRLAVPRDAQREADPHNRRGGRRQAASGPGRRPVLTLTDRVAATLLRQRFSLPTKDIAELFNVTVTTINKVIRETHPLLDQIKHVTEPTVPLTTLAEFTTYATAAGVTPTPRAKPPC
jgi:hypothetical protein